MKVHMHMPGRMHMHKPDWHALGVRLDHLIHDPRFWAALVLVTLLALMILSVSLSEPVIGEPGSPSTFPIYPYVP